MLNVAKKDKEVEQLRDRLKEGGEELGRRVEGNEDYRERTVI